MKLDDSYKYNTYDSLEENKSGVVGLLILPLFFLLTGWGVFNLLNRTQPNTTAQVSPSPSSMNGVQVGIGGAPPTSNYGACYEK